MQVRQKTPGVLDFPGAAGNPWQ